MFSRFVVSSVALFYLIAPYGWSSQPTFYVSLSGDNTTGLSWAQAFTDIQTAIDAAHEAGTAVVRGKVLIDGNVFVVPNGLYIRSNVEIVGSGPGATVIRTEGTTTLEWNCVLSKLTIEGWGATTLISAAYGNSGSIEISRCIIDGEQHNDKSAAAPVVGILAVGGTASSLQIKDCGFSTLDIGVLTVDSGATITRCGFNDIMGDAVRVTTQFLKANDTRVPLMGTVEDTDHTGLNWYRNVSGYCLNNETNVEVKAEANDWSVYSDSNVEQKVNGPADVEPFLGKSIGPGSVVITLKDNQGDAIPASRNPRCVIQELNITAVQDPTSGKFVMASVPPGTHMVSASANGYPSAQASVEVTSLNVSPVTITLGARPSCGKDGRFVYALSFLLIWMCRKRKY
ncbi:MAG TPA: carboxypeptidase-like regulatory domain-containing protein [Candidatus Hydrogenedentes bacterium]|nr:carboxypeptidase-like regulatory domain-containing protein [Candidatus Hydrogenedentota bacterium]HOL75561.1 carboxypeptidase-like regulatory domain-containing protein [Candidatus Hydrogenedentota bacterium]HPO87014.1 carboxypeptidase-like regulatory domain-containing protein [Candidatus Hydrogenedentota bacterium]